MATNPVGLPFYNTQGVQIYPTASAIPAGMPDGVMAVAADTGTLYMSSSGSNIAIAATTGEGTVTSVAMTVPAALLSVTGSPITSSGTLAVSLASQTAHSVLAGPTSGGSVAPTFRALVANDIPSLAYANQTLGNLSSTAVNVDIVPASSSSMNLGSSGDVWNTIFVNTCLLRGAVSGNMNLEAADTTTSYTIKFPAAQGAASSVLQNDGSGNLSWDATGAMAYSAASPSDWNGSAPTTIKAALDRLAAKASPVP